MKIYIMNKDGAGVERLAKYRYLEEVDSIVINILIKIGNKSHRPKTQFRYKNISVYAQ